MRMFLTLTFCFPADVQPSKVQETTGSAPAPVTVLFPLRDMGTLSPPLGDDPTLQAESTESASESFGAYEEAHLCP